MNISHDLVGPPKTDRSWWRGLTECGPLEKEMEKHFTVLVMSISTAASKWPSQHICNDARPYLSLGSLAILPYSVGRNLLGRCLCGFLCIGATCVGFLQPPKSTLFAVGLVCTCLSLLSSPFVPWGCAHLLWLPRPVLCLAGLVCTVPAPARPLHRGLLHTCFRSPACPLPGLMCTYFVSPPAFFVMGVICSFSCAGRVVRK